MLNVGGDGFIFLPEQSSEANSHLSSSTYTMLNTIRIQPSASWHKKKYTSRALSGFLIENRCKAGVFSHCCTRSIHFDHVLYSSQTASHFIVDGKCELHKICILHFS